MIENVNTDEIDEFVRALEDEHGPEETAKILFAAAMATSIRSVGIVETLGWAGETLRYLDERTRRAVEKRVRH